MKKLLLPLLMGFTLCVPALAASQIRGEGVEVVGRTLEIRDAIRPMTIPLPEGNWVITFIRKITPEARDGSLATVTTNIVSLASDQKIVETPSSVQVSYYSHNKQFSSGGHAVDRCSNAIYRKIYSPQGNVDCFGLAAMALNRWSDPSNDNNKLAENSVLSALDRNNDYGGKSRLGYMTYHYFHKGWDHLRVTVFHDMGHFNVTPLSFSSWNAQTAIESARIDQRMRDFQKRVITLSEDYHARLSEAFNGAR